MGDSVSTIQSNAHMASSLSGESSDVLDAHDVRYLSPTTEGRFGLPVGNGDLTAMVWTPVDRLHLSINKSNTWDDAPELSMPDWHWSAKTEELTSALVTSATLDIYSGLPNYDPIYLDDYEARLHLQEGYLSVHAASPFSQSNSTIRVARDPDVMVVEVNEKSHEPIEREIILSRWGSRKFFHWYAQVNPDTSIGLDGTSVGYDDEHCWVQQQLRRISFAVVARVVGTPVHMDSPNNRTVRAKTPRATELHAVIYLAVVTSEESSDPLAEAKRRVDKAVTVGSSALADACAKYWAEFWDRSFLRLPDPYLENLYYLSLYQAGASSSGAYPPMHHGGLWLWNHDARQWGSYYHWNQQQLVWPLLSSGHPELAVNYYEWRYAGLDDAKKTAMKIHGIEGAFYTDVTDRDGRNATNGSNEGHLNHNLTCGSQIAMDFWRHYVFTGDHDFLRNRAYPIMKNAALFYINLMQIDENGVYHVPDSTGYEGHLRVKDCVADLSIIRVSFAACIEAAKELGVDPDLQSQLQTALDNLADYVFIEHEGKKVIATGIAREDYPEVRYEVGRSYTKDEPLFYRGFWLPMSPAFPSGEVGLAGEGTELLEAVRNGVRFVGSTSAGGWIPSSIFAARLGMSDKALEWLAWYVNFCQTLPQGFMQEGQFNDGSTDIWTTCEPWVIEDGKRTQVKAPLQRRNFDTASPECGANLMTAIQEMLLQSYDGTIRVFPATPDAWQEVSFRLWTADGFRVTSARVGGKTAYVKVESKRGGRCRMANPWNGTPVSITEDGVDHLSTESGAATLEILTAPTTTYVFRPTYQVDAPLPNIALDIPEPGPRVGYGRMLGIPRLFM